MVASTLISPMVLIVLFTFSAFFVSPESFDVRIAITSIGFLTIMAFVYVIQEHLPKISYLTWMHWYCFFCFAFVFAVTADVVAVHYFSRHCDDEEDENSKNDEQSKLEGASFWIPYFYEVAEIPIL